jgi:glycine/D-amino acid oxidase-like deaminating enzyme
MLQSQPPLPLLLVLLLVLLLRKRLTKRLLPSLQRKQKMRKRPLLPLRWLPLLGPVPDSQATMGASPARHHDQPRHVPRQTGLHVFTALGSRGISHAALGAEVLASWLLGDPVPAPASLMDALDSARFIARAVRRAG